LKNDKKVHTQPAFTQNEDNDMTEPGKGARQGRRLGRRLWSSDPWAEKNSRSAVGAWKKRRRRIEKEEKRREKQRKEREF